MKEFFKIRFWDIFFSSIISLFLTLKSYDFLYNKIGWTNLNDFYVGFSIYNDHNKYLDIYIYFLYLFLFFVFLPLISKLRDKIFKYKGNKEEKIQNLISDKIKQFLPKIQKFQYVFLLGFIFLHPFNGIFYPKLAVCIVILIIYSIYCIKRKNNKEFSVFALTALIFMFCFTSYNVGLVTVDDHHFGEKYTAFLMHSKFNLEYYRDIMLVHGRMDTASAWLGSFFFNQNNIYGYSLGEALHRNIILILTILSSLFVFGKNILYTAPLFLLKVPSPCIMSVCFYIAMIKNSVSNPVLWFWLYVIFAILFASYWTTIGCFWIISSLLAFIYICYKIPNRKTHLILLGLLLLILSIIFRNSFFEFIYQSKYYIQGTLYAFGNNFADKIYKMPFLFAVELLYKMFALFFTPVIIIELFKQIKKRNTSAILFCIFSILFVIVSLPYTMGRVDHSNFIRLEYVSSVFLCIIMPYWFYKFAINLQRIKFEKVLVFILVFACIYSCFLFPNKFQKTEYKSNTTLFNVGNMELDPLQEKRLAELKDYLYSEGDNKTFLDLTNRGMHYLYFNKRIPVIYTSFYNSISSKQALETVERLRKNVPDYILIYSNNILHDNIFPSLRVNALYRWIFLKQKYEYKKIGENIFLVKTDKKPIYTQEELEDLDYYLSTRNLKFLPEVWANSIKTLPLIEVVTDYSVEVYGNEIKIRFFKPEKIQNIDLLYLKSNIPAKYRISINGSKSQISCMSKSGKILVPLDNFPSWLLNDNLKEITIETNKNIKSPEIKFYNRKN